MERTSTLGIRKYILSPEEFWKLKEDLSFPSDIINPIPYPANGEATSYVILVGGGGEWKAIDVNQRLEQAASKHGIKIDDIKI